MPRDSTPATRSCKKKQANYKRTSWAANNILSTSRKILQKTVVKLDPFVESLKKNNSDLARKNAELQKELTDKVEEILQLQKEFFQKKVELLRLRNFKDCVISSGILEKLILMSGDAYRLHEVISDAFHRINVSSSPSDLSVESSPNESPVASPIRITMNVRKINLNSLSDPNYRPAAQSLEMEIDNSISSPKSSKLSADRRKVPVDCGDVEDTVMSTPRKTLSAGKHTKDQVEDVEDMSMTSPPRKSFKFVSDRETISASPTNEKDVAVSTPPLRSSEFSSDGQTVHVLPEGEEDAYLTPYLRSSPQFDDDNKSSSSDHDPDYTPAPKPKRKKATAARKTSKTSRTSSNSTAHPLKIVFTSNDEAEDLDIKSKIFKPTLRDATQSDKKSSTSELTPPYASPVTSKLKRKKMDSNKSRVIAEEKTSKFGSNVGETHDKNEKEKMRIEKENASEAEVEEEKAKVDEIKNDTVEITTSSKSKSRKRKRRLRLVAEDSVFIPISDMTMEVARGNNKENEIGDITTAHNTDEDAISPKKKLEKPLREKKEEKENEMKEKLEVKPKAKMSVIRSKKEQAKETENKEPLFEPKKVDNEKPSLRTKALSTGAENKGSEVENKRSASLMDERTSPPTSPHRPRRLTSNPVSYVVKLNTKLRQGDKFWCKDN
ncbi:unnamed protein product [Hymenolepis diminuta]|uniref:Uncharacterized protein n=1 Tax=Hymenolepis diminuta TaxID=6216 RepID=A0A564Y8G1_HYMDI|nr:unnamed protein product [Hymenolepis diminuta]